ncbi:hypothetical protein CEXT_624421 [Caerostris extrusa]|uniref:Uncharacterized protein n=1 Tax=Caerostris extrusa TaxID=172846 RepID=A0AAV4TJM2_CAEEX|nr:hypothetical protein CEXT_624421 [Caerostris extrusa]
MLRIGILLRPKTQIDIHGGHRNYHIQRSNALPFSNRITHLETFPTTLKPPKINTHNYLHENSKVPRRSNPVHSEEHTLL